MGFGLPLWIEKMGSKSTTPPADWTLDSPSPEATQALGRRLAERCKGGEVFLLSGELGAGKTCWAAGFAQGLGVVEPAVSPTFVLTRTYGSPRGLTLHHLDFYRLGGAEEAEAIGAEEYAQDDSVVLVEWPERCPGIFTECTLKLTFRITGETSRQIEGHWGGLSMDRSDPTDPTIRKETMDQL